MRLLMWLLVLGVVTFAVAIEVRSAEGPQGAMTISFANSDKDWRGEAYHVNLGLDAPARSFRVDEVDQLRVPVRYRPRSNIGFGIPDQGMPATVDVNVEGYAHFSPQVDEVIRWEFKNHLGPLQWGTLVVKDTQRITVRGLEIRAHPKPAEIIFTRKRPALKGITYTRQPRATAPVPGTQASDASNWQHTSDVGRINRTLAESDVVYDKLDGSEPIVLHNCTNSPAICVAQEARVSPDGTKVAYSVGFGRELREVVVHDVGLGIKEIPELLFAQIWIYDLETHKKYPVPNRPHDAIDRQPEWLNNERLVFASNRANVYPHRKQASQHLGKDQFGRGRCFNPAYCVSQIYGYGHASKSMQLWTMNIDGTDAKNITPHNTNALAPTVMSNGDILYSSWNAHANEVFDNAGRTANNPGTPRNKYKLSRTDGNGADATVLLNGHKPLTIKTKGHLAADVTGGEGRASIRGLRSAAEYRTGHVAVSNYYRSNHVGSLGIIYAFLYGDPHVEGCSTSACYPDAEYVSKRPGTGQYIPSSFMSLTPYGNDQDIRVRRDGKGRPMGKAGYASALPKTDDYMITHGEGDCYEVTPFGEANPESNAGLANCMKGIYRVKVDIVTDPFDTNQMELMAGGKQWHIFDSDAVATFQDLHGKPIPDQLEPLDPEAACYLAVVDAKAAELAPAQPYDWKTTLYDQCSSQGCAVNTEDPDFHRNNMEYLVVLEPELFDYSYPEDPQRYIETANNMGHKSIRVLGAQRLMPDGSVKMQVPCETPLIMLGADKDGVAIAHDDMLHSLRKGETRTCHGCHDGHSEERAAKLKQTAVERFERTQAYRTNPPLQEPWEPITFLEDVLPIVEKRCQGCHKKMNNDDGLLYSRIAQDYEQFDWPNARKQPGVGTYKSVVHVLIKEGGTGYQVGEALVFESGAAMGHVDQVGPQGQLLGIRLTAGGDGYPPLSPVTVATKGGQGADLEAMTSAFQLPRPYTSKWVAKFARDSLLYWKCVGERRDGRTDAQYENDIDFGPAHVSGATAEECRTIGQWIDTGVQR